MSREITFPSWSVTFDMPCNEDIKDFLKLSLEYDEMEKAIRERIVQLFNEYITSDNEEAKRVGMQIFSIGYQLGYNDCHGLLNEIIEKK